MHTHTQQAQQPIGVFDSGMGGLTVLKALKQTLPQESFVYLGDTARLPYGAKSQHIIRRYAEQMARVLIARGIKLLVVACNSATSASIPYLKKLFPDLPIIGVIEPGAMAALRVTRNQRIALLATEATVHSGIYQDTLLVLNGSAHVIAQSASLLVAIAEEGDIDDAIAYTAVKKYLQALTQQDPDYDVIILGCTHFPVFMPVFNALLGEHVALINSAQETADVVQTTLHTLNLNTAADKPSTAFLVTDLPDRFARIGSLFLGAPINVDDITLVDALA